MTKFASLFIGLVVAVLVFESLLDNKIYIAPLSVPESLADNGYTGEVAAQRLYDALHTAVGSTNSRLRPLSVAQVSSERGSSSVENRVEVSLEKITIPTVGFSIEALASTLHSFFGINGRRQNLSGEFTIIGGKLRLRMRLNGREFWNSQGVDPDRPDELLKAAVPKVFHEISPYLEALLEFHDGDPEKALEMAQDIVAVLPAYDSEIPEAYSLMGHYYYDKKRYNESFKAYQSGVRAAPTDPVLHYNLGVAQGKLHHNSEAKLEYSIAILLNPNYAKPHTNLATILNREGRTEEAITYYRIAGALDPNATEPHECLSEIFSARSNQEDAVAERRKAARIHFYSGETLRNQGRTEKAIKEYQKAVDLDSSYERARRSLEDARREAPETNPIQRTKTEC